MDKIKAKPTQKEVFLEQIRASIKATATEGEGIQLRIPITETSSGWAYDKNASTLSLWVLQVSLECVTVLYCSTKTSLSLRDQGYECSAKDNWKDQRGRRPSQTFWCRTSPPAHAHPPCTLGGPVHGKLNEAEAQWPSALSHSCRWCRKRNNGPLEKCLHEWNFI